MPYVIINNQRVPIRLDNSQQVGEGGMGLVYRLGQLNASNRQEKLVEEKLVAKIFKNPTDPKNPSREKLTTMIERPPEHVYEVINGVGYTQFAWVRYLIMDDNDRLIGYAMPELDFDRSISLNPFIYPNEGKRLTAYQNSLNYRVQLGANISALMADLHAHGHAFIDFKEPNMRLMPEPVSYHAPRASDEYRGFIVGFIDCDSYRITRADGKIYPSPVISPEMTSPEYHEHKNIALLDEKHDRFVLAIELFKILNNGIHPFYFIPLSDRLKNMPHRNTDQFIKERLYAYGQQPHPEIVPLKNSIHEAWDDVTRTMFDRAFLSTDPAQRPSASEWETHLRGLVQHRQFVACDNFPEDASHIHFIGKPCHKCGLLINKNKAAVNAMNAPQNANINTNSVTSVNVWQTPVSQLNNVSSATNPASNTDAVSVVNPVDVESLEQNRRWEQSLNQQKNYPSTSQPLSESSANVSPVAAGSVPVASANTNSENDYLNSGYPNEPQPDLNDNHASQADTTVPTRAPAVKHSGTAVKHSGKGWLVPVIIGAIALGGYGASKLLGNNGTTTASTNNTASASANGSDNNTSNNTSDYRQVIRQLPEAKANIDTQLAKQGGLLGPSAKTLYQDTLGIAPEFFNQVQSVAKQGTSDLDALTELANSHDIVAVQTNALTAFRDTDMRYFAEQPVNSKLAKQFNEAAKNYYWNKNDAKGALYLQAQAVKNAPNQGEYAANLAFYLFKNDYPNTKDFVLYALQTPRDAGKYPNTYMIELASALAIQQGNTDAAVGALLTQYYTAEDRAKRCQNMLRYPKTYPELVPVAEQVFAVINEQHISGKSVAANACLPPYRWVKA